METEIAPGIMDVTGQPAQPAFAEARPQQRTHRGQQQTGNHQNFAQLVHVPKMAREDHEGNEGFGGSLGYSRSVGAVHRFVRATGPTPQLGVRRQVAVSKARTFPGSPKAFEGQAPGNVASR